MTHLARHCSEAAWLRGLQPPEEARQKGQRWDQHDPDLLARIELETLNKMGAFH